MISIKVLPSAPQYVYFAKIVASRYGREVYEVLMMYKPGARILTKTFKEKVQAQIKKETGRGASELATFRMITLCIKCGFIEARHSGVRDGRLLIIRDSPFRKLYPRSNKKPKTSTQNEL